MKNINVNVVTEEVVIVYFNRLIEKYAASSLWSTFSVLKSTLFVINLLIVIFVDVYWYKLVIKFC
jgi:hypothetical protein